MKDKIKRFLIDKKELLVFIAVVLVVFSTVVTIASLALNDAQVNNSNPTIDPTDNPVDVVPTDNPVDDIPTVVEKFSLPVNGEYEVVRTFFDSALSDEELVNAIIFTGSYMVESKGMSYAKPDNSVFDVCSIYDGVVVSIVEDELNEFIVTIKHDDELVSIYSSLNNICVEENDTVNVGQVIGKATTSLIDVEAGVHVHLQVKLADMYINPSSIFGKELSEVVMEK